MNYSETYVLEAKGPAGNWIWIGEFDRESAALKEMESLAHEAGSWRVKRITEVTVATISKA